MPKRPRRDDPSGNVGGANTLNTPVNAPDWRLTRLQELFGLLRPFALESVKTAKKSQNYSPYLSACESYDDLVAAWRKALYWTDGLDCTLSVMLGAAATVQLVGEQLWIKIIGPPSSGKTTLIEGLATAKNHVLSKDTIRGFYSGWRDDGEDESIAALCRGKALATKDGDTLLRAPNREQILAEARGLYDKVGRTHYRNKVAIDYEGHRMTWLLCGTSALREIDDSELGARFLDCVVMEGIENEFEDEVIMRAAMSELSGMRAEADGRPDTHHSEELTHAMMMTGGYLSHLRGHCVELANSVTMDSDALRRCGDMGKFIAFMRARPSKKQDEHAEREFSARLSKQIVRLAMSQAITLNRTVVDDEVLRRVRKVTLDTSRGKVLKVVQKLLDVSMQARGLAHHLNEDTVKLTPLLRFLRSIGVLRYSRSDSIWHLSKYVRKLYERVVV